jgi:hypothetical protein
MNGKNCVTMILAVNTKSFADLFFEITGNLNKAKTILDKTKQEKADFRNHKESLNLLKKSSI